MRLFRGKPQGDECARNNLVNGDVTHIDCPRQCTECFAYFCTLVEAFSSPHLVGDGFFLEDFFISSGLGVDAVQHGNLAGLYALADQFFNLGCNITGLSDFIRVRTEGGLGTLWTHALQLQHGDAVAHSGVVCTTNDRIGQVCDVRGGTVVALQQLHRSMRVAARKVQQVVRCGSGEGINGLVCVSDDGDVVALP